MHAEGQAAASDEQIAKMRLPGFGARSRLTSTPSPPFLSHPTMNSVLSPVASVNGSVTPSSISKAWSSSTSRAKRTPTRHLPCSTSLTAIVRKVPSSERLTVSTPRRTRSRCHGATST